MSIFGRTRKEADAERVTPPTLELAAPAPVPEPAPEPEPAEPAPPPIWTVAVTYRDGRTETFKGPQLYCVVNGGAVVLNEYALNPARGDRYSSRYIRVMRYLIPLDTIMKVEALR